MDHRQLKEMRNRLKQIMDKHPVIQRAYQNAYRRAKKRGVAEFYCIEAGREAALKAFAFITKQRRQSVT